MAPAALIAATCAAAAGGDELLRTGHLAAGPAAARAARGAASPSASSLRVVADTATRVPGRRETFDFFQWPHAVPGGKCQLFGEGNSTYPVIADGDGGGSLRTVVEDTAASRFTNIMLVAGSGGAFAASDATTGDAGVYAAADQSALVTAASAGIDVGPATDAVDANGVRYVGFLSRGANASLHLWSGDTKQTVTLADVTTAPWPGQAGLNYFSSAPRTHRAGDSVAAAFFASRTNDQPGGLRAAVWAHTPAGGLRALADTGDTAGPAYAAFADPCVGADAAGEPFVGFVALVGGQRKLYVSWLDGGSPVEVVATGDATPGCGGTVTGLPNSPGCADGALIWYAESADSNFACSGVYAAAVRSRGSVQALPKAVADGRATAGGAAMTLAPKAGQGGVSAGGGAVDVCMFYVTEHGSGVGLASAQLP